MTKPQNLASDFVVMSPAHSAPPITVSPTIFEELGSERFSGFRDHVLVSSFEFTEDWPSWERHPAGDEFVVLVSGAATMVLETPDGEERLTLSEPGDYAVVPKNTWHTAKVAEPTRLFFFTPGEGTENRDA